MYTHGYAAWLRAAGKIVSRDVCIRRLLRTKKQPSPELRVASIGKEWAYLLLQHGGFR